MRELLTWQHWKNRFVRQPDVVAPDPSAAIPPTLPDPAPPSPAPPDTPLAVDPIVPPPGPPPESVDPTGPLTEEQRKKRNRRRLLVAGGVLALVGAAADAGIFTFSSSPPESTPPKPPSSSAPVTPGPSDDSRRDLPPVPPVNPPVQPEDPPQETPPDPSHVTTHVVGKGETEWKIAKDKVRAATGREPKVSEINIVTDLIAAANIDTHPDPDALEPGDILKIPNLTATNLVIKAIPKTAKTDPSPVVRQVHEEAVALNNLPAMDKATVVQTQQPHLTQLAEAVQIDLPAPPAPASVTKRIPPPEITVTASQATAPTENTTVFAASPMHEQPLQSDSIAQPTATPSNTTPPAPAAFLPDWFYTETPISPTPAETARQLLQQNFPEEPEITSNKHVQESVEILVAVHKQTEQPTADELISFVARKIYRHVVHATPSQIDILGSLLQTLQKKPSFMKLADWDEMRKKTIATWYETFLSSQKQTQLVVSNA